MCFSTVLKTDPACLRGNYCQKIVNNRLFDNIVVGKLNFVVPPKFAVPPNPDASNGVGVLFCTDRDLAYRVDRRCRADCLGSRYLAIGKRVRADRA